MSITDDIIQAIKRWPVWLRLGFSDTASKYRRSVLGPLWLTLGMGITVAGLGTFWSLLWKVDIASFFPYLTAGLLTWGLIVGSLVEGCACFVQQASVIRAAPMPLFLHPLRLGVKLMITFLHNLLVFVAVGIIFKVPLTIYSLLLLPGMGLMLLFSIGVSLALGILGTRYRDLLPIVESIVPLAFFVTPVLWLRTALGNNAYIMDYNPFTHLLAVIREPLLGLAPSPLNYAAAITTVILIWIIALSLFSKTRNKISLWI